MSDPHPELKTNATNRRIREIITSVRSEALIPRPDFQRRLVWTTRDRIEFIDTILANLPFPEIYVCAGEVNPLTAQGTEWLVDGQQRVSTIVDYFAGDPALHRGTEVPLYAKLGDDAKRRFLEYTVVVRDLGAVPIEFVKKVFARINSTRYGLNAMELANARYDGAIKKTAEKIAENAFYSEHGVFTPSDVRRMTDVSFSLTVLITMEQGYFDDTDEHETYLERYNEEYVNEAQYERRLEKTFAFIDSLQLAPGSRWWKKADVFTLIVEIDSAINLNNEIVDRSELADALKSFEGDLKKFASHEEPEGGPERREALSRYSTAAAQGSNHRKNRIERGKIVAQLIKEASI